MTSLRLMALRTISAASLSLVVLLGSCSSSSNAAVSSVVYGAIPVPVAGPLTGPALTNQWIVGWSSPPENALQGVDNEGSMEQTFRFIIVPDIDGTQERIHFSNVLGTTPLTIGAARLAVALSQGAAVDPARNAALTFNGAASVTIPAGGAVVSDPVKLTYKYGERMAVTMYLKGTFGPITQHEAQVETNFTNPAGSGDSTTDTAGNSFTGTTPEYFLLTGMDVYGAYQGSVAFFGSSSVDGHNSNFGSANNYPTPNVAVPGQDFDRPSDWLARDMLAAGYRVGVFNAGTIADPAAEDATTASSKSQAGIDRMSRDVLQQAGIKSVVIYFGGVDLRSDCVAATSVEASLSNMVAQANAAGVRVVLATLPPSEYCTTSDASLLPSTTNPYQGDINPGPENPGSIQRNILNTWIRTTGPTLPGVVAIADFDAALAYPAHPDYFMPQFYTNDNFHPTGAGYGVQSAAVNVNTVLAAH